MSTHTDGPWIADNNEGFSPWTIWSRMTPTGNGITPGPKIADIHGDSAEGDANARLIAAAPDLLEACKAIVEYQRLIDSDQTDGLLEAYGKAFEDSAAAVAKALGSTS